MLAEVLVPSERRIGARNDDRRLPRDLALPVQAHRVAAAFAASPVLVARSKRRSPPARNWRGPDSSSISPGQCPSGCAVGVPAGQGDGLFGVVVFRGFCVSSRRIFGRVLLGFVFFVLESSLDALAGYFIATEDAPDVHP